MNAIVEHPTFTDTTATSSLGHYTTLTANRQAAFLKSLQLFGNVRLACRAATVSPQTAYRARRSSRGFALAWDAALLAAREHAEQVLADRAINGVEEAVYYHGEEVARRRRYDSRLLLAHLARLDRLEEREEVAATLPLLDAAIGALEEGAGLDETLSPQVRGPVEPGNSCGSPSREAPACAEAREVPVGARNHPQDTVPCVPSCRTSPQPDTSACDLETRLCAMEAARPAGALSPYQLAGEGCDAGAVEHAQLLAFEAGEPRWWEVLPD